MASNPVAIDRSGGFGGFSPGAVAIVVEQTSGLNWMVI